MSSEALDTRQSLIELGFASDDDLEIAGDMAGALLRAIQSPMRRLGVTELYLLTKFNVALEAVVPLVLERLDDSPMLQAAEFPGDLLTALLESDGRYWLEHRDVWESALPLLAAAMEQAQTTDDNGEVSYAIGDGLAAAVLHFMSHHRP